MSRRKKKRAHGGVELNMAAMLDMVFQLLTFFILTFKPAPIEGEIELRMPPPQPVTRVDGQKSGADPNNKNLMKGFNTLTISVYPRKDGSIQTMAIGEAAMGNQPALLEARLKSVLTDTATPFEQVIIQIGSGLRYDALMSVIDVCTRQKLSDGKPLTKLSFVELPDGSE